MQPVRLRRSYCLSPHNPMRLRLLPAPAISVRGSNNRGKGSGLPAPVAAANALLTRFCEGSSAYNTSCLPGVLTTFCAYSRIPSLSRSSEAYSNCASIYPRQTSITFNSFLPIRRARISILPPIGSSCHLPSFTDHWYGKRPVLFSHREGHPPSRTPPKALRFERDALGAICRLPP